MKVEDGLGISLPIRRPVRCGAIYGTFTQAPRIEGGLPRLLPRPVGPLAGLLASRPLGLTATTKFYIENALPKGHKVSLVSRGRHPPLGVHLGAVAHVLPTSDVKARIIRGRLIRG